MWPFERFKLVHRGAFRSGGGWGGRSVLEAVSWVSGVVVASLAGGVVSVDNCRSGAGCTEFEFCSISVEVVGVLSGAVSGS